MDLEVPTVGFPLVAARKYESSHAIDGPLGFGWRSSLTAHLYYATYLYSAPSTYLKEANVTLPDGTQYRFVEEGAGLFTPPLGRHDSLVRNGDGTFDLTLQHSMTRFHFGNDGSLQSLRDDYGNTLAYTYDGNSRLQRVADASGSGRFFDVFWGADGRISAVQDSAGRTIGYTYNASGALTSQTDPLNRATYYTYVMGRFAPLLAVQRDNWNRVVTEITFDSTDRVASYTEKGETYTYAYSYAGDPMKTAKTDSLGNRWVFTFNASGQITDKLPPAGSGGANHHTDYALDGSVQQEIDESGVRTSTVHDEQGRIESVTRDYEGPLAIRFDYAYDPEFPHQVAEILPRNPTTGLRDANWKGVRFDYYPEGSPAPGALHHEYLVRSDGSLAVQMTYEYDTHGLLVAATDATGGRIDYEFNVSGDLTTVRLPSNNDLNERPEIHYAYDSLGRAIRVTDPLGNETSYTHDSLGRVVSQILPPPSAGSTIDFTTRVEYDVYDDSARLTFVRTTDPNGSVVLEGADQFDRLRQAVDAAGNVTRFEYAAAGLASVVDANGNETNFEHDALGRLSATTFPEGNLETYTYWADGQLRSTTDRRGQTTSYAYDRLKRLLTKTYPGNANVSFVYAGEKLQQVTDGRVSPAEVQSFDYDGAFRVVSNIQGDRGSITYTYTPTNRVESVSVGGTTTTYTYYPDLSVDTISWSPAGMFKFKYGMLGDESEITYPTGQKRTFSYDRQRRLTKVVNIHPTAGVLASYTFGYDYDDTGLPTQVGDRTSSMATVPVQGLEDAVTTYRYDSRHQLSRVQYPLAAPFFGELQEWTYDAIGNRVSSVLNGVSRAYTYDTNGAGSNGQRLQADGMHNFAYDANGNLISQQGPEGSYLLTWDADHRLASVSGSSTATYTHDYRGRRVSVSTAGATRHYVFEQLEGIDVSGYGPVVFGPNVNEPLAAVADGEVLYFAADDSKGGSVVLTTDSAGTILESVVLDVWGVPRGGTAPVPAEFGFAGGSSDNMGLVFFRNRSYEPSIGRFIQEDRPVEHDPRWRGDARRVLVATVPRRGSLVPEPPVVAWTEIPKAGRVESDYLYGANNPISNVDPDGATWSPKWPRHPLKCGAKFYKCWFDNMPKCKCIKARYRTECEWNVQTCCFEVYALCMSYIPVKGPDCSQAPYW